MSIWVNLKSKNNLARGFCAGLVLFPAAYILFVFIIALIVIDSRNGTYLFEHSIILLLWIICSIASTSFTFQETDEDVEDIEEYLEELEEGQAPQRRWGAIAAGVALLSFLLLPLWESHRVLTGIDLWEEESPMFLITVIVSYILAIFSSLSSNRVFRGFGVGMIGWCLILIFSGDRGDFGIGAYLCIICIIASIILAFRGGKSTKAEEVAGESEDAQSQEFKDKAHQYSDEQLNEIVNAPDIYNVGLIAACKEELEIRKINQAKDTKQSEILSPQDNSTRHTRG